MNTNLQNMFAIDTAVADGSKLDISGYNKKKIKKFENSIEFKDGCYYVNLPWIENRVNRVPSNFYVALKVLDRTMTSLRKNKLDEAYKEVPFSNRKRMESLRYCRYSLKNSESLFGFLIGRSLKIMNR